MNMLAFTTTDTCSCSFNRGASAGAFGSSLYYAYGGVIFELMRNGYVASVTVFAKRP